MGNRPAIDAGDHPPMHAARNRGRRFAATGVGA